LSQARPTIFLPALLALLNAVGPISSDMYLPAFPAMRAALGGGPSAAPMSLAAWFIGLAAGQLVLGPLSDRTGRKAPLLIGAVVYVAGCLLCALATSMDQLLAFRCVAAIGGAANLVVARAIIRDSVLDAGSAAHIVARVQIVMSIAPMITPLLGGLLVEASGWRSIFLAQTLFGILCLLVVAFGLRETLPPERRFRHGARSVALAYARMGAERDFASHALIGSLATFSLFAFLGGAPLIFLRHFGLSPTMFGLTFVANGLAYAAGTRLNATLIERAGERDALTWAVLSLAATAAAMLAFALTGIGGAWAFGGCFALIMLVLGCVLPGAAIGAIGPHSGDAGIASALYGTEVFAIGALGTVIAGLVGRSDPAPVAAIMLVGAVIAAFIAIGRPVRGRGSALDPMGPSGPRPA
jgi:DHA1 family bicyclomycin/chloramphenicol resistance-like MFS transporter